VISQLLRDCEFQLLSIVGFHHNHAEFKTGLRPVLSNSENAVYSPIGGL